MEILPADISLLKLENKEKILARWAENTTGYGYLLLNCNPALLPGGELQIIVTGEGILFLKVFPVADKENFLKALAFSMDYLWKNTANALKTRLLANKAICDGETLKFSTNYVFAFPELSEKVIEDGLSEEQRNFVEKNCLFKETYNAFHDDFLGVAQRYLNFPMLPVSEDRFQITDNNINSILQRLTPEYEIIRVAEVTNETMTDGASEELLVVDQNDKAVRAFRLDQDQINIVNKIHKGEQLVLACAGSGKSVLLIAKCFKAAEMNPKKQFLLCCYSSKLYRLYEWYIDRAGLKGKNVSCFTFHGLCRELITKAGYTLPSCPTAAEFHEQCVADAIALLNANKIRQRYYGIFIDEVQIFNKEWYKFAFNLLENSKTEEHIFVICGDKTQNITKDVKNGDAPWQAGDPYPKYRGKKSMRIEKNYRNSIEINEFINCYSIAAKKYLNKVQPGVILDPDLFLRGQSVYHGNPVQIKRLERRSNRAEAESVVESIRAIHDDDKIPYDEIAVTMYYGTFAKKMPGWENSHYNLEKDLQDLLNKADIPYTLFYEKGSGSPEADGVRLIKFQSVLGLDFRAVIVCGLMPLGAYEGSKVEGSVAKETDPEKKEALILDTTSSINSLYVACTRAKEDLYVILPETGSESVYVKLIEEAYQNL